MAEYGGIDAACTYHRGSRTLVDASAGLTVVEAPPALPAAISLDSTPAPLPTWAIAATPLSIRLDAFYNRLTTGPQTVGFVDGQFAPTARVDRTLGLAGSLVAATSHSAAVAPYVSLGAGFFVSHLNGDVAGSGAGLTPVTLDAVGLGVGAGGGVALRSGPVRRSWWTGATIRRSPTREAAGSCRCRSASGSDEASRRTNPPS